MQRHGVLPGVGGAVDAVGGVVGGMRLGRPPGWREGFSEGFGRLSHSRTASGLSLLFQARLTQS